jgi:molybdate transport system ATP-binding protein
MKLGMDFKINYPGFNVSINQSFNAPVTGIFGPSGSGKTSILNALAGLLRPHQGRITCGGQTYFDSENRVNLAPEKRNIGYVFQEDRLFPHLDVAGNLRFAAKRAKSNGGSRHSLEEMAKTLGIDHLLNRSYEDLSGGEKRRVAVVRSILSGAKLLLLDEPTNGLDNQRVGDIIDLLMRLRENGVEMLLVTHDLDVLLALTDEILLMEGGKCVAGGNYWKVLEKPAARRLLYESGMVNVVPCRYRGKCPGTGFHLWQPERPAATPFSELPPFLHAADSGARSASATLVIRPQDVALSLKRVEETSIQNQLPGRITQCYANGTKTHLVIDVGFPLLARVTPQAARSLELEEGKPIWCLIKSGAIRFLSKDSSVNKMEN